METVKNDNILYEELKSQLKNYISANGMRDTPARYIILKKICEKKNMFAFSDIYNNVLMSDETDNITDRTIYFTLDLFERIGLISRYSCHGKYRLYYVTSEGCLISDT